MRIVFSSQVWDETFQRVTNEQEIYEGDDSNPSFSFSNICLLLALILISLSLFPDSSPAPWPDAAEAGELLPHHYRQTDQPLHPVHSQSQREARAQVW